MGKFSKVNMREMGRAKTVFTPSPLMKSLRQRFTKAIYSQALTVWDNATGDADAAVLTWLTANKLS